MSLKDDMDALAGKIREGIFKEGCYVLHKEDLELLCPDPAQSDEDKRRIVRNFSDHYGFVVQLSPGQMTAVFRALEP